MRALRQRKNFQALLLNASLDDHDDGIHVAQQIRSWDNDLAIVLLARDSSEELAIGALRAGVNGYFRQPIALDELSESVRQCVDLSSAQDSDVQEDSQSTSDDWEAHAREILVGDSPAIEQVKRYIHKVAPTDSNVLITGETGTGKELVAQLVHQVSPRHK